MAASLVVGGAQAGYAQLSALSVSDVRRSIAGEEVPLTRDDLLQVKRARSDYPIHELIANRWSPRAFDSRVPDRETLATLFEAARWAPSSYNEQPWRFIVGVKGDGDTHERIVDCLVDVNRQWAGRAPVLIIAVTRMYFSFNDRPNRHAFHDVGLCLGNLILQATSMGLYVHLMAGFDPDRARSKFLIPAQFEPVVAGAIGYLGDPEELPGPLRQKELAPRERRPLSEIVYTGEWGCAMF